jgi:thiol-disulfide isomerase/thioredoxin
MSAQPTSKVPFSWALGCLLAALCLFPLANSCAAQLPVIRFVRDPDPAPEFKLKTLDGKDLNLESSRGKVILLNFWATWCGPCREELPGLISLQNHYKDRLQIIGLVVDDEDEKEIRNVVESEGINYPVAIADSDTRFAYGGIAALPTIFLINTNGRVVQKHVGLFNPALFEAEVRALLDLPIAAKVETFQDEGDIFLKHADRAKILPGVDLSKLSPEERDAALHKFNAESCDCGCKFTLAQCRIYDPACQTSQRRTGEIIKKASKPENDQPKKDEKQLPTPVAPTATPDSPQSQPPASL